MSVRGLVLQVYAEYPPWLAVVASVNTLPCLGFNSLIALLLLLLRHFNAPKALPRR